MSEKSVIEIPRQVNMVFVFTRSVGALNFHTYMTSEEVHNALLAGRDSMVHVEGADQGGAGRVDQWFETKHDTNFEIIALAVKMSVSGKITHPEQLQ